MEENSCNGNDQESKTIKLDDSIQAIIEEEGFINYNINKQKVSTKNSNYLGTLYTIDIKGQTKDGDKEVNIFVKNIKPKEETIQILSVTDVYKTELFAYKELFKIYEELQEEANIPIEKRYKVIKGFEQSNEDVIIMENIAKRGYETWNRMNVPSFNFAQLSIQALAKFHALSFVLKEKRPEYFENKIKSIDNFIIFEEAWPPFVESVKNMTIEYVDEVFKDRVEQAYANIVKGFPKYYNDESAKVCLCHGDFSPHNILLKKENSEEREVLPLDYQLMYYGCPVSDFLYFIFFSSDQKFRKNHMEDLKNVYYDELTDLLKYFDLEAEAVYPREEFERAYKEKLDYGLMITLLYLAFMFVTEDVPVDVKVLKFNIDGRFNERLRGILEDYEAWGLL